MGFGNPYNNELQLEHQGHERSRLTQVSFPNHVNSFVVGRLRQHISKWRELTSDHWVLATVSGYPLKFARQPVQSVLPKSSFNQAEIQLIDTEVEELLLKRAVTRLPPCKEEFISNIFLVPQETGDMRPVINLKPLNQYIQNIHFKMENIQIDLN